MGISLYRIKKWYQMLKGTSIWHVNQNMGKSFEPGKLEGYFNNLTEKVLKDFDALSNRSLPRAVDEEGNTVVFPVAIFQYGLGAWDLFLQTGEEIYNNQFLLCAEWAYVNQLESGAWDNFSFVYPENPYGAMCQGEGASLLVRAWKITQERRFLLSAQKAINYMLVPVEEGGTAQYNGSDLVLLEYTHLPAVLNGWIFALAGLYDLIVSGEGEAYRSVLEQTLSTLEKKLPQFDNGYWSMYDLGGKITSPFYHDLHIAQMQALWKMTGREVYKYYDKKWQEYRNKKLYCAGAFINKAWQKILE